MGSKKDLGGKDAVRSLAEIIEEALALFPELGDGEE